MKSKINIAEVRRLAAQIEKSKPPLGLLKIKDGKAYFTDAVYLVVMGGYEDSEDALINLNNYSVCAKDQYGIPRIPYPNLESVIGGSFNTVEFKDVIINGRVEHEIATEKSGVLYIDHTIKDQLKKLVAVRNFEFDIAKIKVKQAVGLLEIDEYTQVYFGLRRRAPKESRYE